MDGVGTIGIRGGSASVAELLVEFGWLDRQRGLAPVTVHNYCWNASQFLSSLPEPMQLSVGLLDAGKVTAFMVEFCRDRNTNTAKSMARSVLVPEVRARDGPNLDGVVGRGPRVIGVAPGLAPEVGAGGRPGAAPGDGRTVAVHGDGPA